jgi:hypothetical protein
LCRMIRARRLQLPESIAWVASRDISGSCEHRRLIRRERVRMSEVIRQPRGGRKPSELRITSALY